ncbi:MAG: orotidine-5'-phosphate decarboxylase [Treponema sp.]|nr:orotidine-5'-phosphate decarboxylase [Treponema sp.]
MLFDAVAKRGPVCVGLDTSPACLPPERGRYGSDADAAAAFNRVIIDATRDIAACYKVQIACYEALGIDGLRCYSKTLAYLREQKLLVIADIKRGDIADTAKQYAAAHFSGDFEADFVTLSPYMGMDSIEPWLEWAVSRGKGAFVLMRTSNRGMRDFEYLELAPKPEEDSRRVYDAVGEKLAALAASHCGTRGYGAFGAVVGVNPSPYEREEAARLRARFDGLFFLVPGYGAQGGTALDAAMLLREGNGGVVNASRSILTAWKKEDNADFERAALAARKAAEEMRGALQQAVKN